MSSASAVERLAQRTVRDLERARSEPIESSMPEWKMLSRPLVRKWSFVAARTRPPTTSGCWRHTRCATTEPNEYPATIGRSSPSSVITAATSSAQSCSEKFSEMMPRPCHRWSKTTTR